MIKVLVISNYNDTHAVRPEAECFIGLAREGVDITIMTFPGSPYAVRFAENGIKLIEFHPQTKFSRSEIRKIRETIVAGKYRILHLFNSTAIINGIRASSGLPVKVVLYRGYAGNIHWYDPSAYFKYLHPRVDKIICNSLGVEEMFCRQLFFNKEKAVTIHKGHDIAWYASVRPAELRSLNIPEDAFTVSCVANNRKMKGIEYLLGATYNIPVSVPVYYLLIGNDLDKGYLSRLAAGSPNSGKIRFLGYRRDALEIVAVTDVFVLPSVFGESITKSVIEAMAMGVPPVITDIPGNRELVIHRESGLVVPPHDPKAIADGLTSLFKDREFRLQLGSNARERIIRNFNIKDTILNTLHLYESLA